MLFEIKHSSQCYHNKWHTASPSLFLHVADGGHFCVVCFIFLVNFYLKKCYSKLILTYLPFHADAWDIPKVENILEHPDFFEVHKLFTLRDLFNANVHLGHFEGCWDPLMKPYLYGIREHHHIIDLNQTVVQLRVCISLTIA